MVQNKLLYPSQLIGTYTQQLQQRKNYQHHLKVVKENLWHHYDASNPTANKQALKQFPLLEDGTWPAPHSFYCD